MFAAQILYATQPTQVRRTFDPELNADIEDNLSLPGTLPYKYPTNFTYQGIPFAVYLHLISLSSLILSNLGFGGSS